jgi:hypothetical protein
VRGIDAVRRKHLSVNARLREGRLQNREDPGILLSLFSEARADSLQPLRERSDRNTCTLRDTYQVVSIKDRARGLLLFLPPSLLSEDTRFRRRVIEEVKNLEETDLDPPPAAVKIVRHDQIVAKVVPQVKSYRGHVSRIDPPFQFYCILQRGFQVI